MNVIQRIIKNSSLLTVSAVIRGLFGFLTIMVCAQYLGVLRFGILSFAIAFADSFVILTDIGLSTYLTREIAKDRSEGGKLLSNVFTIKLGSIFLFTFLFIVFIQMTDYFHDTVAIVLIILTAHIFVNLRKMFNSVFRAHEQMEYIAVGDILNSGLLLLGAFFAITRGLDVLGFALTYAVVTTLPLFYAMLICYRKFIKLTLDFNWVFWKKCLNEAWPLGGMTLCIIIYFRIDVVMLSFMKGDIDVGIYSAAYRLSEAATIIPLMLVSAIFPVLSKYHEQSVDQFNRVYRTAVKYLSACAFPVVLTVLLFSDQIVAFVYRDAFIQSSPTLRILIWASAIMYVTMVLGNVYISANRQRENFKLAIIAMILNIALNLALIPQFSYLGASYATVATEVFGLIVGLIFLSRWGYVVDLKTTFLPQIVSFIISGILAVILLRFNINVIAILACSILVYSVLWYKLGFEESDKNIIKSIFNLSET